MKQGSKFVALASALLISLPVAAQDFGPSAKAPKVMDAAMAADVKVVTAKIEAVDQAKRTVAIKGPMGRTLVMKVGDQVKNFAQVKVGDEVVVKYVQAVSLKLEKGVVGRSETVTTTAAAAPGAGKPRGAAVQQTVIVANVERIDAANKSVLLEGPNAGYVEVRVKPAILKDIKVNDKVVATITDAIIVDVQAPANK